MKCSITSLFFSLSLTVAATVSNAQTIPDQKALTDFDKLKDGDMVFIESSTSRADAIKKLSKSIFSHCGIVFRDGSGVARVYEGAGRQDEDPVSIKEWQIKESTPKDEPPPPPAKYHPVYARRMPGLTEAQLQTLKARANELHHTKYDHAFQFGNTHEGGDGKQHDYIYCSELNYFAFKSIGIELSTPKAFKDYYDDFGPEKVDWVKALMTKELNKDLAKKVRKPPGEYNPDDKVISPQDVFADIKLEKIE